MTSTRSPQYLVDAEGKPTAVVLPLAEYERLKLNARKLRQRNRLAAELSEALREVAAFQKSGKRPMTVRAFLESL